MRNYLFLLAILSTFSLQSQTYYPLLDSINRWTFVENGLVIGPESQNCYYPFSGNFSFNDILETTEDTVINSFTYKRLIQSSTCEFGFIREDTVSRRIYFVNNVFNPEELIYDFSMQPGDSISLQFYYNPISPYFYWEDGIYTLDSIRTAHTIQGMRNGYYLSCHSCLNSHSLEWIEGIGNLVNPIYTYSVNDGGWGGPFGGWCSYQSSFTSFLICYSHDQLVYFDSCNYNFALSNPWGFATNDSCSFYSIMSGINENDLSISFYISQNPFHEFTQLIITDETISEPYLTIYDYTGKMIINEKVNNQTTINRGSLKNGMYIYKIADSKGHTSTGKLLLE